MSITSETEHWSLAEEEINYFVRVSSFAGFIVEV
jgi:hypothetical protein